MKHKHWSVEELRALSARLHADQGVPIDELVRRDRGLMEPHLIHQHRADAQQGKGQSLVTPHFLLKTWLKSFNSHGEDSARPQLTAFMITATLLISMMTFLGVFSTKSLLHYAGSLPINVLYVVAVLLAPQCLFLLTLIMRFLLTKSGYIQKQLGLLQALCINLVSAIAQRLQKHWAETNFHKPDLLTTRRRTSPIFTPDKLLQRLTAANVYLLTQVAGSVFYLASLLTLLALVTLTDLSFGWSTTLQLSSAEIHRTVEFLLAPWLSIKEALSLHTQFGVMTLTTVEQTQFFRLDPRFTSGEGFRLDPAASSVWWQFVCVIIVLYGLLPRLILAAAFFIKKRRLHVALNLQEPDLANVLLRWRPRDGNEEVLSSYTLRSQDGQGTGGKNYPQLLPPAPYVVLLWRDFPLTPGDLETAAQALNIALADLFSLKSVAPLTAEQTIIDLKKDLTALARPASEAVLSILILVEYFEGPSKAFLQLIQQIHLSLRKTCDYRIYVLISEVQDGKLVQHRECHKIWERKIADDSRIILI